MVVWLVLAVLAADGGVTATECGVPVRELGGHCSAPVAVPPGFECWEDFGSGTGRMAVWQRTLTLIDRSSCRVTTLLQTGGAGSPESALEFQGLPATVPLTHEERERLRRLVGVVAEDGHDPSHALSFLAQTLHRRQPQQGGRATLHLHRLPFLRWWKGTPPTRFADTFGAAERTSCPGTAPCERAFSGSSFHVLRDWPMSPGIRVVLYANGSRNRWLAALVAEKGRYRWIHLAATDGREPLVQVRGDRWWLVFGDLTFVGHHVMGFDTRTGGAWQIDLGDRMPIAVGDDGLELESSDSGERQTLRWNQLSP